MFSTIFFIIQVCFKGTKKRFAMCKDYKKKKLGLRLGDVSPITITRYACCIDLSLLYINVILFFYLGIVVFFLAVPHYPSSKRTKKKHYKPNQKLRNEKRDKKKRQPKACGTTASVVNNGRGSSPMFSCKAGTAF